MVKNGSRKPRDGSRGRVRSTLRLVLVLGLVAGALRGAFWLRDQALTSERFALRSIEVQGSLRTEDEQVVRVSGLRLGQNLLAIETKEVESRVRAISWIRDVRVVRDYPDRIRLSIEEHRPVAMIALGDLYYLSDEGTVFKAYVSGEPFDLPLVVGIDRDAYQAGDRSAVKRAGLARSFLEVWRTTRGESELPRTIEVGAPDLVRYTRKDGTVVIIGPPPWKEALQDAERALARASSKAERIDTLIVGRGRRSGRLVVQTRFGKNNGKGRGPEVR